MSVPVKAKAVIEQTVIYVPPAGGIVAAIAGVFDQLNPILVGVSLVLSILLAARKLFGGR